jgi:hypothetical protein
VLFHVGPGCRLAVADGLKRTAVAVDGNYTIYGTSTGLIEVYEGDSLVYVKSVGAPVLSASSAGLNIAYETPAGAFSLVVSPVEVVTGRGAGRGLQASPGHPPGREDAARPRIGGRCHLRHVSETVLRQADAAVSLRGPRARRRRGGLREAGVCWLGGGGVALRVA